MIPMVTADERVRHEFRAAYDTELRGWVNALPGDEIERIGPVVRKSGGAGRGFITYRDLDGLAGTALDTFIAAQRDHFAGLSRAVEWKYHDYDEPADLPDRLTAAGFRPEEPETVVIGDAVTQAIASRPDPEVTLRRIHDERDLDGVRELNERVWGREAPWLVATLAAEIAREPEPTAVFVAEARGEVVSAAWLRFHTGTRFASLWGGATLPKWRGRGVYRALVARRAQVALANGYELLQVDCSDDSRPILLRLGMTAVAVTVPYVWTPPGS